MLKSFFCTRVEERDKSEPQPIYFSTSVLIRLSPNKQHFLEQVKYEVSFIIKFYVPSRNLIWNRIFWFLQDIFTFLNIILVSTNSIAFHFQWPWSMTIKVILVQSTNKVHSIYKRLNSTYRCSRRGSTNKSIN